MIRKKKNSNKILFLNLGLAQNIIMFVSILKLKNGERYVLGK